VNTWVVGASGAWGRAISLELLRLGHDVVALGRSDVSDLAAWAERQGRTWTHVPLDLLAPDLSALPAAPDALFMCAVATDGDRESLLRINFTTPVALVEQVESGMRSRGFGRIGVLVGQNARLGLRGLGDFSATQGALWTWCEAHQQELEALSGDVQLTVVLPPRTSSRTQQTLSERVGRRARLHPPAAGPIVRDVLKGRRRAGRRPTLAALAMLFR
jgi:short-subunit dehydrogenase